MKPRPAVPHPALVALAALLLPLAACDSHKSAPTRGDAAAQLPPLSVTTARAERAERPIAEPVVGNVAAFRRPVVSAQVNGTILRTLAEPGQRVRRDDLLAEISAPEAEARLSAARAELNLAQQDFARTEQLLASRTVSREAFDQARARLEGARAAAAQAEAAVGYRQVRAPIDGMVRTRLAEAGEVTAPGRPLFELEDETLLRLEAFIPESLSSAVAVGDSVTVRIDAADAALSATLAEITPAADPVSRTFLAKFDLPPTSGVLSGQFGRALIPAGTEAATRVPAAAVRRRGQIESVFVVADGRAVLRLVRTGRTADGHTDILAGIEPGETVVVEGAGDLVDGRAVGVR